MLSPHYQNIVTRLVVMAFITVVYVVVGKIGLGFASIHASASPVWAPAGMAVAFFLLFGFSVWPTIVVGAFLVNVTTAGTWLTWGSIAVGNTLEGLLGAWLVQRFAHGLRAFESSHDVFKFAILAGLLSPTVSATIGVTSLTWGGLASLEQFISVWLTWWLGDAAGILIITPVVVLWTQHPKMEWKMGERIELVVLVLVLFATCEIVFGAPLGVQTNYPMEFFLVPVLIWAAFRFSPRETASLSVLLAAWTVWGTMNGQGPFTSDTENAGLLLGQSFLGVNTVMSLALAAGVQERMKTEALLHESMERVNRFAAMVESSDDAIISKAPDGTIITWNKGAERLFGYTEDEVAGRSIALLLPPGLNDETLLLSRITAGERIDHFETQRLRKDGSMLDVSLTLSSIKNRQGFVIGVSTIMRDISARKYSEHALQESQARLQDFADQLEGLVGERTEELLQAQARLRALAQQLTLTEQRERNRMATELHDHLQQMLALAKMKLSQGERFAQPNAACAELIHHVNGILTNALNYTRTLVAELSPPVLREHGLAAAMIWLGEWMKGHDMNVTVEIEGHSSLVLPEDKSILLFQSVRELLINAAKHSESHDAWVSLQHDDGKLRIAVRDNGKGFDVATATHTGIVSKFGLYNIRERMQALGGTLELASTSGNGTTVTLTLPLQAVGTTLQGDMESDLEVRSADKASLHSRPDFGQSGYAESAVSVLLVDDHAMVRQGLRSLLECHADVEVVGEAGDGEEGLVLVEQLRPAVVIMDINMPKMNGIQATAKIKERYPGIKVIGLSVNTNSDNQEAMRSAGAEVLITKEAAVEQLYGVIKEIQHQ